MRFSVIRSVETVRRLLELENWKLNLKIQLGIPANRPPKGEVKLSQTKTPVEAAADLVEQFCLEQESAFLSLLSRKIRS